MKKWVLGLMLLLAFPVVSFAQQKDRMRKGNVTGVVFDDNDKSPIMQATVQVLSLPDSAMVAGNVTNVDGQFSLSARPGRYVLKISYIGYRSEFLPFALSRQNKLHADMGRIMLKTDAIMLQEATVVAQAAEVAVVEDTVVYNTSAYRLPEGAALEALVKKLPGAEIDENGKITINGKEVKKIMVDGKEFFANDPNVAMKNLPVNIIDKVKAYDRQSDMARITGIADGDEETVLDLTVKPGMNKGWFGNADAAGGTHERYNGKMILNRFQDDKQFTVLGGSNNVNDMDFPGAFSQHSWGGQNGLNTKHRGGFNFATKNEKWETGGSVNFDMDKADVRSKEASETFVSSTSSSFKNALKRSNNDKWNLVSDFRFEWKPNELTNFVFRPEFSFGNTDNLSNTKSATFNQDPMHTTDELMEASNLTDLVPEEAIINMIKRNTLNKNDNYSYGASLLSNRRLGKPGRNISLRVKYKYSHGDAEQFSTSNIDYYQADLKERTEILNRYITTPTSNLNTGAKLSYSEPIAKNMFLQLEYDFQFRRNESDNSTYDMPFDWTVEQGDAGITDGTYNVDLSKRAVYHYYNHQVNLSYKWITKNTRLNAGVSFLPQNSKLNYRKGELDTISTRKVFNFTPTLDFRQRFSKTTSLHLVYRGKTDQPNMVDLLPTRDDTDPLNVRVGNPNLKPSFTNTLRFSFNHFDVKKQHSYMAYAVFRNTLNGFSSRRVYDENTGGYITRPENIDGNWNLFGTFGGNWALKNKKYTVSSYLTTGYNHMASYISSKRVVADVDKNITKQLNLGERLRGTYRNDIWELSLNGSIRYVHSRNSYQEANNMDTYQFSYGASTNINLPWNMVLSTDLSQNSRRGYTDSSMNRDELIWNAQISQNFLKGNAATVSLQFYDILQNQSNISRTITAAMRADTEYNAIYSYCMVHFIYRLNIFGGGKAKQENRGKYGRPHGRGDYQKYRETFKTGNFKGHRHF